MRHLLLTACALALTSTLAAQGALLGPCFETNYGTNLNLGDDAVAPACNLGFPFPGPGTTSVTSVDVSSNGFVWLGSSLDPGCCDGDPAPFVAGLPRIAALWMDLDPGAGGAVWFRAVPASGGVPARAVITWAGVPEFGSNAGATFQLQMYADGSFALTFDNDVGNTQHTVLTGVTEGNHATATAVDLSSAATAPIQSGANPTVYQDQPPGFDLAGMSLAFVPNGAGGYLVLPKPGCAFAKITSFGRGCPKPLTTYELFTTSHPIDLANTSIEFQPDGSGGYVTAPSTGFFTGYTNRLTFGDDDAQGPFPLPFAFPFGGLTTGAIDIVSNGFVWLQSGNPDPRCCDGSPLQLVNDAASIAALWMDLDPTGAPASGGIFFDVVGTTETHVTWVDVPEYPAGGSNTFQITLRSDGSFRLAYHTVANQGHDCLVGISDGNGAADAGPSDWSAGVVRTGHGGTPLALAPAIGAQPRLGTTFPMAIDAITAGSLLGVMVLGTTTFPAGIDLTPLGMPGCALYASLDVLLSFPLSGPPTPFALAIPANASLAGVILAAQAATLTPVDPLGLVSSNGLELRLGL